MNTTVKIIGGFLAGAAIGAASGILMAPQSGKKTRKKVMDSSKQFSNDVVKSINKSLGELKETYNSKLDDFAKKSKTLVDQAKNSVKV